MTNVKYSITKPNILQVILELQFVGEKMVASLSRSVTNDFNIIFCCLDRIGLLGEQLKQEGFTVLSLNRKPGFDYTLPLKIAHITREYKIDIIHSHHYSSFFYSSLSRLFNFKPRLIFTEHGRPLPDIVGYKQKIANIMLQNFADKINAVCEFSKQGLSKNEWIPASKIEVIYNGVEINENDVYQDDNEKIVQILNWIGSTQNTIGFLARLDAIKAPDVLIRAFAQVLKEVPDSKLVMIGKGEMKITLEQLCTQYNISDKVLFTGLLRKPHSIFPKLKILVAPSLYEAASLSILEAMMFGIPVVASKVGGNPELIADGINGYLIAPGFVGGFAQAITLLLKDSDTYLKFSVSAAKTVKERFNLEGMVSKHKNIYKQLLRGRDY